MHVDGTSCGSLFVAKSWLSIRLLGVFVELRLMWLLSCVASIMLLLKVRCGIVGVHHRFFTALELAKGHVTVCLLHRGGGSFGGRRRRIAMIRK